MLSTLHAIVIIAVAHTVMCTPCSILLPPTRSLTSSVSPTPLPSCRPRPTSGQDLTNNQTRVHHIPLLRRIRRFRPPTTARLPPPPWASTDLEALSSTGLADSAWPAAHDRRARLVSSRGTSPNSTTPFLLPHLAGYAQPRSRIYGHRLPRTLWSHHIPPSLCWCSIVASSHQTINPPLLAERHDWNTSPPAELDSSMNLQNPSATSSHVRPE